MLTFDGGNQISTTVTNISAIKFSHRLLKWDFAIDFAE